MRSRFLMPALAGIILAAGCNESTAPTRFPVVVTEREFNIALDRSTANSGEVVFQVHNVGEDHHEFLVIRTDARRTRCPRKPTAATWRTGRAPSSSTSWTTSRPGRPRSWW